MTDPALPRITHSQAKEDWRAFARGGARDLGAAEYVASDGLRQMADDVDAEARAFFRRDEPDKRRVQSPTGFKNRGCNSYTYDDGSPSFERLSVARFDDVEHARRSGVDPAYLPLYENINVWPDGVLRDLVERFRSRAAAECARILVHLAEALDLAQDTFTAPGPDNTNVSLTKYFPRLGVDDPRATDEAAFVSHVDRSFATLLTERGERDCLQVLHRDGGWITCRPDPASFVLVFGLGLETHTAGLVKACRHRVLPPVATERTSTAAFYFPSLRTTAGEATVGKVLVDAIGRSLP
jgi:isopenicillin N synthase-like dioxygenase